MAAILPWIGEVDTWVQVPVTITRVRVHPSRYGHTMVRHDFVDDDGRTAYAWNPTSLGETGDRGRLTGKVTAHETEFGRSLTRFADPKFRVWDPDETAFEDQLAALLDAPVSSGASASVNAPDGAKRAAPADRSGRAPIARPTTPVDDLAWTKRFKHLDFED